MVSKKTIVLITGGNNGIGLLTAEAIAASSPDYHVIIGSRNLEKGEVALKELQKQTPNGTFSVVQLDVTEPKSIDNAVASVSKDYGVLDVLINNAGITSHETGLGAQLRELLETNTIGCANVTEAFLPLLLKSSKARLLYLSSDLGSLANRTNDQVWYSKVPATAYRVSKAALNMLMVCHHVDLKDKGVKVWAVNPGYVVTDLSGTGDAGKEERVKNGAGDPKDSAKFILSVVQGVWDRDVGKLIDRDGVLPW